ncbi:probable E3 ubiquitin-protein ligase RNF217 [Amborella trichopoda]|uniref:RBR-type E3 ubiquitin transferase n=1 Tax=Amborella trichopoda TaxID=13333 RepID=W1NJV9_AMBTC|nr:probable E3 ubiquitin-protein ligase RNF217 [Amborella trichopoda]ERM96072.1 hypothetical protein AMTR_s00129p00116540 [Amborella trichopoda]|eukprot:XP_020532060.1 probable E3 ubiquitin-protein ligase RNF217 [Amborella trichopoda]
MASEYEDEFHLSLMSLDAETQRFSDEAYAGSLQLQEIIFSSIKSSPSRTNPFSLSTTNSSSLSANSSPYNPKTTHKRGFSLFTWLSEKNRRKETETGSSSSGFFCDICTDHKAYEGKFSNPICSHSYCKDCIVRHIESRLQENHTMISCPSPSCKQFLERESCKSFVPKSAFERWGAALSEASILGISKFYCPFKDCSELLEFDGDRNGSIKESECPYCNRLFCARCRVAWHHGLECWEFEKVREDERGRNDILFLTLAEGQKWKKCPNCKIYVEKKEGCPHITCRCKYEFCYNCGSSWSDAHRCR